MIQIGEGTKLTSRTTSFVVNGGWGGRKWGWEDEADEWWVLEGREKFELRAWNKPESEYLYCVF